MGLYRQSDDDKKNLEWFRNSRSFNSLQRIAIEQSSIRGLGVFEMEFRYPITVIVGENGAGKSTILSLVSCAFHNDTSFCPMSLLSNTRNRQRRYYTYSDFFAFAPTECGIKPDIKISSTCLSEKKSSDTRSKTPKGKWKDYDTRPKRAVSFLGVNRILPPSESKTYRNYSGRFSINNLSDKDSQSLVDYMNRIFAKDYTEIRLSNHNKYRLYGCSRTSQSYTGFNMGAGENAVLQLLYEILSAGKGALIVVDEIELGLHVQAQTMLMKVLKELCLKNHCQIICSSHSSTILSGVPYEGRIMIQSKTGTIEPIYGISEEMAISKLSGENCAELTIMVEDSVAKDFIETVLPFPVRQRVQIVVFGSADCSMMYAIQTYLREGRKNFIAVMDGDMRAKKTQKIDAIVSAINDSHLYSLKDIQDLLNERLIFLPGDEWPESVIVKSLLDADELTRLRTDFKVFDDYDLKQYLRTAKNAGKHSEFYSLASNLHSSEDDVRKSLIRQYEALYPDEVKQLVTSIAGVLNINNQ